MRASGVGEIRYVVPSSKMLLAALSPRSVCDHAGAHPTRVPSAVPPAMQTTRKVLAVTLCSLVASAAARVIASVATRSGQCHGVGSSLMMPRNPVRARGPERPVAGAVGPISIPCPTLMRFAAPFALDSSGG